MSEGAEAHGLRDRPTGPACPDIKIHTPVHKSNDLGSWDLLGRLEATHEMSVVSPAEAFPAGGWELAAIASG